MDWDVDGKLSQPEVGGNNFLGHPSLFYSSLLFSFLVSIIHDFFTNFKTAGYEFSI